MTTLPRLREILHRALALGAAGLVLLLVVLAASPSLHARLHGEKYLDPNDACAVVLFAQGVTPAVAAVLVILAALRWLPENLRTPAAPQLGCRAVALPPGRGPPAS